MHQRFSVFSILREGLRSNAGWGKMWREPEPKPALRRRHRRRRRPRPRDRLLPRQAARHHQRGGGREGLDRLRQCRAATPRIIRSQLPAARQHPVLRKVAEAVGRAGAGHQLQRHGQPARRAQPVPLRRRSATPTCGAATPCGCTASMPNCSTASRCARCVPWLDFDNARFPIQGGLLQRRGGTRAPRRGRLGLRPRRRRARRRHHAELRGAPASASKAAASLGVETTRGFIGAKKVGLACAGNSSRVAAMAGLRLPIESHVLQAFVSEGLKPLVPSVITVRRRPFLHQPVRQGRPRVRRRSRRLQFLRPARQPADRRGCDGGGGGADAGRSAGCACCAHWGGVMDMSMDGCPIIDRTDSTASTSTAAGATAASRRRPPPASASPTDRQRTSRTRSTRAYRLDRFATGALIDERGAGAAAEPALRPSCCIPCPIAATRGHDEFAYLGDATAAPADRWRHRVRRRHGTTMSISATTRPGGIANSGSHGGGCRPGWWSTATCARTRFSGADGRARRSRRRRRSHDASSAAGGLIDRLAGR